MCDPITATIGAGVIGGAGAIFGGISAKQTGDANAALLQQQAALRTEKAKVDIEAADLRQRRAAGERDAKIGTTGIDARSFSDVLADDLATGALEKALIKYGGQVDANNLNYQAQLQKSKGNDALIGSFFSAAGSVLGGYGQAGLIAAKGVSVGSIFGPGANSPAVATYQAASYG